MVSLTKFAAVAAIVVSTATIAGAQSVTSATKPFSLGISGGASIPTGDLSNSVNTGYNIGGHIGLGTPSLPISWLRRACCRFCVRHRTWCTAIPQRHPTAPEALSFSPDMRPPERGLDPSMS